MSDLRILWRLAKPLSILHSSLLYLLGLGIAKYLGATLDATSVLGILWVWLVLLATHFFNVYFIPAEKLLFFFTESDSKLAFSQRERSIILTLGFSFLASAGYLSFLLLQNSPVNHNINIFIIGGVLAAIIYAVPPFRLSDTGYGDLLNAVMMSIVLPAFAFVLQHGEMHRLVAMTCFPVFGLHLAMIIVLEFPDYARDVKRESKKLLVQIGWQRGMFLHNIAILGSFLLIGLAVVLGLPAKIGLPSLLALPLGFLQIWHMGRIADGHKPNWTALVYPGVLLYLLVVYLLGFSFWIR